MPDVSIMCSGCGLTFQISEYALGKPLKCPTCGTNIKTTKNATAQSAEEKRPSLKLGLAKQPLTRKTTETPPHPDSEEDDDSGISPLQAAVAPKQPPGKPKPAAKPTKSKKEKSLIELTIETDDDPIVAQVNQKTEKFKKQRSWAIVTFLLFGSLLGVLRWGHLAGIPPLLPTEITQNITYYAETYGPYLMIFIHVTVIIMAFNDAVLNGILCLLVPFYSLRNLAQ